ncbi:hypothetical protein [Botrimarina sp.]|uniref:hypothetical protein n=1 Tax=Botrimarina sp. TaxID=2795802 RepID=UPI0032EE05D4
MDLSRITVFCFAASYAVALVLEAAALAGRRGGRLAGTLSGGRRAVLLGITAAGLFAHVAYLVTQAGSAATPLASPAEWCLLAAAVLAAIYLTFTLRHARWAVGVFLLPVVLLLVGMAYAASDRPFSQDRASLFWGQAHGWLLVAATASVSVGFVAGLMYLVQSWRLKHKTPPARGWSLPSLEWLQTANTRSLSLSVWLMVGGFLSGLVLTRLNQGPGGGSRLWSDPVVLTSSALLAWLVVAAAFRWAYPPARHGRKVAYLTVTAFGFLAIVLGSLTWGGASHGARDQPPAAAIDGSSPSQSSRRPAPGATDPRPL